MADILDPQNYQLQWLSGPYFLAAAAILALAAYVLVVSGEQLLRVSFLIICAGLFPYAASYGLVGATSDPQVAASLYKLGLALVPVSAAGAFAFESILAQQIDRYSWVSFVAVTTSLAQAVPILTTDLYVESMWQTSSGLYHFAAGPLMPLSLGSLALWMLLCAVLVRSRLKSEPSPLRRSQLRGTLIAFSVIGLSAVDVLSAYRVDTYYPTSWLFLLVGTGLLFRSIVLKGILRPTGLDWRTRLILLYVAAAAVGLWLVWALTPHTSLVYLSFLTLGVYLVLRAAIALLQLLRDPYAILSDTPLERVIEQYTESVQASHAAVEIAEITRTSVTLGLGCKRVDLIMPVADAWSWQTVDGQILSAEATPDPSLTQAWLPDHPGLLQRIDLPALSLDDDRELVDNLFETNDAEIVVPLVNRDELVGLLLLGELPHRHALNRSELRFMGSVQEHLSAALVYARMHQEANTRVAMQNEVELAAAIQRAFVAEADLLECDALEVSGLWAPATQCGGDWWSVHRLPDGRVLILIGDVTGHGVAAAMVTAAAKGCYDVVQRLQGNDLDLPTLLHHLDTTVRLVGANRFHMTCFASLLDAGRGVVTYANAGHLAPYVCRMGPNGVELGALVARGNPLGAGDEPYHPTGQHDLASGDVLVWYTDGIVECNNAESVQFGERRMQRLLRKFDRLAPNARSLRDYIVREVAAFQGGTPADDDITLVVARVL